MVKPVFNSSFIDRYVRGELSEEEECQFETSLLDCPELQSEAQTVLAIREALWLDPQRHEPVPGKSPEIPPGTARWQPLALAASVLLAVFSTTMYWKVSNETSNLQLQLNALRQPQTDVVMISIDVLRSSGDRPVAVIQKPANRALLVMDIELGVASRQQDSVHSSLRDESGQWAINWTTELRGRDAISVAFFADQLPDGRVWLEISRPGGELLERRLLEFLPSPGTT